MILGDVCTRNCGYCAIAHGRPTWEDREEPERLGRAVGELGLEYVVITSVNRDDLADGGAAPWPATPPPARPPRRRRPGRGAAAPPRRSAARRPPAPPRTHRPRAGPAPRPP